MSERPTTGRLEVRDTNGNVVVYFIPAATPEQEAEFRQQLDGGVWVDGEKLLTDLAAELRAGRAPG